jgi:hypothetical protein
MVGNTLQTEVTYTIDAFVLNPIPVGNTLQTEVNSVTSLPKSMLAKDGIYFNIKKNNINDKISD